MSALLSRCRTVRLSPKEAFTIFGFAPRSTIDWAVVQATPAISIASLEAAGLSVARIQQIQPSLAEWWSAKKASQADIGRLEEWKLHVPSECPEMGLMDCVQLAPYTSALRMVDLGLTIDTLRSVYSMDYQHMILMLYSLPEWIEMGFDYAAHGTEISDANFIQIFQCTKGVGCTEYYRLKQQSAQRAAPGQ